MTGELSVVRSSMWCLLVFGVGLLLMCWVMGGLVVGVVVVVFVLYNVVLSFFRSGVRCVWMREFLRNVCWMLESGADTMRVCGSLDCELVVLLRFGLIFIVLWVLSLLIVEMVHAWVFFMF